MKSRLKMSENERERNRVSRSAGIKFHNASTHGLKKHVRSSTRSKKIRILKDLLAPNIVS